MANIRDRIIKTEPESYDAFVYRWTNLDKDNKKYIGFHTGFVGDGYNHSGQCDKFNEDFQNEDYEWQYEVLDYGTTDEMKNLERDLLKSVEAKESGDYYNQTNAGSGYFHANIITTDQIVNDIQTGNYLQVDDSNRPLKIKKDLFQELLENRVQVRVEDNSDGVKHISDEIDEDGGTANCDAVVLLEDKFGEGKHQLLDGSTTMMGTLNSKHGLYLSYSLIPKQIHTKLSEYEIRQIGLLLNPKQKNKKWESADADLIDHIMIGYQVHNVPINAKSNKYFLKKANCNGPKISKILAKCKQLVLLNTYTAKGTPWIRYSLPQHKPKIEIKVNEIEKNVPNTKVFNFSSEKYRWEDIVMYLADNDKSKKKKINISVIVHFPHPKTSEKKWNRDLSKVDVYMEVLCSKFGIKFLGFEYMQKY